MSRIKLQNMTPSPYYMQSRDFQFIGRLFDVMMNSVKTNADLIYYNQLSDNSDERLADLMALTLGLKLRHRYPATQLKAVCSVFMDAVRNKGSLRSIEIVANALINAEGINERFRYEISEDCLELTTYMPSQLNDLSLFRDMLDYLLPAGMTCHIVSANFSEDFGDTKVGTSDETTETKWEAYKRNKIGVSDRDDLSNKIGLGVVSSKTQA